MELEDRLDFDDDMEKGLDRKKMADIKKRFVRLNKQRLQRMRKSIPDHQRDFSDVITLAIHENHPILPGYVNKDVPCGISDYTPGKIAIRAVKRIAKSFTLKKRAQMRREILSIFIMGSAGTIGHSGESDLDIWVCHRKGLDKESLALLQKKLTLITQWAKPLGLEAHFFPMDEDYFRRQHSSPMDKEGAGSSQHFMLLDEFYRTAILLAGRYPLWWMVPVAENNNYKEYSEQLLKKRYLRATDWIDFGPIPEIPANEFFGAALWQVYKGIDSPYKSVLKIALMEVYASMHPDVSPLCQDFKQLVYDEDVGANQIDPYLMVYRKVESYLQDRMEFERLELIRRCFYIKVSIKVSITPIRAAIGWRRELITELIRQWSWEQDQLLQLDSRKTWKVIRVVSERRKLVQEITNCYKFLSNFARNQSSLSRISQQDINLLGRKLYAAFERRSGKVEFVNPGIAPNLYEEFLTFQHQESSSNISSWLLFKDQVELKESSYHSSIKRSENLIELISWAYLNGLLNKTTKLQLNQGDNPLEIKELKQVCNGIIQRFPVDVRIPNDDAFKSPARNLFSLVIINLGTDPMAELTRRGLQLISNKTDALDFGNQHLNLAVNFEMLNLNSWGEILHSSYKTELSLIYALSAWLQDLPVNKKDKPALVVQSYCKTRSESIVRRVNELWDDITDAWYTNQQYAKRRYLFTMSNQYVLFEMSDEQIEWQVLSSQKQMYRQLASACKEYSPLNIDRNSLVDTPLSKIFSLNKINEIQLFYYIKDDIAEVWVLDETGTMFYQQQQFHDHLTLLNPYSRFLQSVIFRQGAMAGLAVTKTPRLYQLTKSRGTTLAWKVRERLMIDESTLARYSNIQVIASENQHDKPLYTYYCNDIEFSPLEYGDQLLSAVAKQILRFRNEKKRYPAYITDLDISAFAPKNRQVICQYLEIKKNLEAALFEELHKN
ncbi:MAG: adenylate cyclase class 1 [Enterobacterales bacterium]|jgi:adenylate cyclase class 1